MTDDEKVPNAVPEYINLREEIQNRSKAQADLLKLHIGALTSVIGAALSMPIGPWVIVAAAVESSLLGCWYVNHSARIVQLGAEGLPCSQWAIKNALDTDSTNHFRRLMWWTFDMPAVTGLVVPIVLMSFARAPTASGGVAVTLPAVGILAGREVVALSVLGLGATLYLFYLTAKHRWYRLADARTQKAKQYAKPPTAVTSGVSLNLESGNGTEQPCQREVALASDQGNGRNAMLRFRGRRLQFRSLIRLWRRLGSRMFFLVID